MKEGIHPNYRQVEVKCACGESFKTRAVSNDETIKVEICNKCHPFYTGKQKKATRGGRIERFKKKYGME